MKRTAILLLVAALSSSAIAAEHWVEVTSKGQGPSRDKAIENGLYLAVCKVQGVAVSSVITTAKVRTGAFDVARDKETGSKKISVEDVSANLAGTLAVSESRGLVKTYDIVEEKQINPDTYEVNLKVQVYDYQSPEDAKKLRLAVFPMESTDDHRFGTVTITGKRLGEQFSQYLNTILARNEKFTVLDRDTQAAILKEKRILMGPDAPVADKMRLGEALGADYMVVGTIPQAELTMTETDNPAIGGKSQYFTAYMEVEYRLIVGPTRQIAASDQLRIKLVDAQVKALAEKWRSDDIDYNELEQKLVQQAARQMADMVGDYLYPVRVAAVKEGGVMILNQGGKRFAEGDVLEMGKLGADIIDPETGKSLGKDETGLGTIKITKVLARISYAVMTEGKATEAMVGNICRRASMENNAAITPDEGRSSEVRQTGTGGVQLPSDDRGSSTLIKDK
jgi:curli biogenesis system outer membrane secretion channel CsgG